MCQKDTLFVCKVLAITMRIYVLLVTSYFVNFAVYNLLYKVGERLAVREIGVAAGQSTSSPRPSRVEVL
jgi:hypothetical protein